MDLPLSLTLRLISAILRIIAGLYIMIHNIMVNIKRKGLSTRVAGKDSHIYLYLLNISDGLQIFTKNFYEICNIISYIRAYRRGLS